MPERYLQVRSLRTMLGSRCKSRGGTSAAPHLSPARLPPVAYAGVIISEPCPTLSVSLAHAAVIFLTRGGLQCVQANAVCVQEKGSHLFCEALESKHSSPEIGRTIGSCRCRCRRRTMRGSSDASGFCNIPTPRALFRVTSFVRILTLSLPTMRGTDVPNLFRAKPSVPRQFFCRSPRNSPSAI